MARENPNVYVPQQFENPANPMVHRHHTGLEILEQVAGPIHGFCSGIGTGGTITGIGEVLKALNPDITIWAVEPENAAILAGGTIGTHLQMGIGDGLIPDILNREIYDDIYVVTDEEAIQTAKDLARKEGLMCGISSGTNVAAALKLAEYYEGYEVLVCTHTDREHIHSHFLVNSVNFDTGKKLHIAKEQLQELRQRNDQVCMEFSLPVFNPTNRKEKTKTMSIGEYHTAARGQSKKLQLMNIINDCMRHASNREGVYCADGERGLQGTLGNLPAEYHLHHTQRLAVP